MPQKPKSQTKPPIAFPYFLREEEDRWDWVKTLRARQQAFDEFHRQVMAFLLPQQVELTREWQNWWGDFIARHDVAPGTELQLNGRVVGTVEKSQQES